MTPADHTEFILKAAGSSMRHYEPRTRQAIIEAVEAAQLAERARIVAFLRSHPGDHARVFAKSVEDGAHHPMI